MHILRPCPGPTEPEALGAIPRNKPSGWFWCMFKVENHCPKATWVSLSLVRNFISSQYLMASHFTWLLQSSWLWPPSNVLLTGFHKSSLVVSLSSLWCPSSPSLEGSSSPPTPCMFLGSCLTPTLFMLHVALGRFIHSPSITAVVCWLFDLYLHSGLSPQLHACINLCLLGISLLRCPPSPQTQLCWNWAHLLKISSSSRVVCFR